MKPLNYSIEQAAQQSHTPWHALQSFKPFSFGDILFGTWEEDLATGSFNYSYFDYISNKLKKFQKWLLVNSWSNQLGLGFGLALFLCVAGGKKARKGYQSLEKHGKPLMKIYCTIHFLTVVRKNVVKDIGLVVNSHCVYPHEMCKPSLTKRTL